ncbi:MAG TPA: M20/M25/M40 family metallo-hydrolase [Cyclobacteriaceae bacterium]|nr:M20/M25/M40 family metallo-hydrolase [Cyclobacteriaceae bacterium]
MKLLESLCAIHAPSGSEAPVKEFLLDYIKKEKKNWKVKPQIVEGEEFQDCLILKFGKPTTAIFAHMDSIGFTVRYQNQLVAIGSPDADGGTKLVGEDMYGQIECELELDSDHHAYYKFGRAIARGTTLTYKPNFRETREHIESPYLDDRLGIYNALKVAETLTDGVIVFSCWEEHGGGSVPYLADYIYNKWGVRQALISDVTWATEGVELGLGVAISLRDRNVPRKVFIDKVLNIARKKKIPYQLEVEGSGSSDGGELQRGHLPFDWVFIGPPSQGPHSPNEKVHKSDIDSMIGLYKALMKEL